MEGSQGNSGWVSVGDGEEAISTEPAESIREALGVDEDGQPKEEAQKRLSDAAQTMGRRGGRAAAERRAADAADVEETEKAITKAKEDAEKRDSKTAQDEKAGAKPKDKRGDPRHDPKARMLEATQEAAALKRENAALKAAADERDRLREENESLRRAPAPRREATPRPQTTQDDPEPQLKDYEGREVEFVKAQARWEAKQEFRQMAAAERQASEHATKARFFAERAKNFETAYSKALAEEPELTEKLGRAGEAVPISILNEAIEAARAGAELPADLAAQVRLGPRVENYLAEEIFSDSENAPRWLLYFAAHPGEFDRLAQLSNGRVLLREMGRIEERLEAAASAPSAPRVSSAKPPVRPHTGSPRAAANDDEDMGNLDGDEYVRKNAHRLVGLKRR